MLKRLRHPFLFQVTSRRPVAIQRCIVSWALMLYLGLGASHITTAQDSWTYSTPKQPEIPAVANQSSVQNDIDAFILRKLETHGLALAERADKGTLIRRLYLDLIGIPPSREEMNTVLTDESPEAISRLIDHLLDDPRYGEHWARAWLDLARYADTAGYEGDPDLPHAWRYRDYVIDSLNRDKPYSQFVREQIAGDELQEILGAGELPDPPAENLVALTFLRLAPFTEPRGDETRHELLSEMTGTVSSVFLGLTVGCAQCHDHMYDPIPTEDFYRLKAFFSTIQIPPPRRGDIYQLGGPTPAPFYMEGQAERIEQRKQRLVQEAASAAEELGQLRADWTQRLGLSSGFGIQALGGSLGNDYVFDQKQVTDGGLHRTVVTSNGQQWQYTTDDVPSTSQGSLAGSNQGHWFGGLDQPDYLSLGAATNGHARPEAAFFHGKVSHLLIFSEPLDAQQLKLPPEKLGQLPNLRFWLDASDLDANPETPNPNVGKPVVAWKDKISGLEFRPPSEDQTPHVGLIGEASRPAVEFDNDFLLAPIAKLPWLEDKQGTIVTVFTSTDEQEAYLFEVGGAGQFIATFVNPAANQGSDLLEQSVGDPADTRLSVSEKQRYRELETLQRFLPQQLRRLEPLAMTLRHSFGPPYEPGVPNTYVLERGDWNAPGILVEAGFPRAFTDKVEPAHFRLDPFKRWPTRGRRKVLADWIASADHPLTARVIANRLWQGHFGRGIVSTPSDFGNLGDGPSHPKLLDYLACYLTDHDWSLKALHRLICNSRTYQQVSRVGELPARSINPSNDWLWAFPSRRLRSEAIRDRILSVSGRLNQDHFGPPIFPPLPDQIEDSVKYNESKWATQYGEEGRKRSIYIYQQRTLTMPMLQVFDGTVCDQSRPQRQSSTTPLQSLAMYNGPLLNTEVPYMVDRVFSRAPADLPSRIGTTFQMILARTADPEEIEHFTEYCQTFETERVAIASLARILCNSNEFLYLD